MQIYSTQTYNFGAKSRRHTRNFTELKEIHGSRKKPVYRLIKGGIPFEIAIKMEPPSITSINELANTIRRIISSKKGRWK